MSLFTVERSRKILESALEALTILPSDQVLPVFDCMKVLVPKVKVKQLHSISSFGVVVFFLVKCNTLFSLFSASGLSGVSLHRSIWFGLENYILFEQHTANILVQSKSFCAVHLWYRGSSCGCKCKAASIWQNKRGQFMLISQERILKFYLDLKMYFTVYFSFSYWCFSFPKRY